MSDLCWVNGRVVSAHQGLVRIDDSAFSEGRGCFTTGRWMGNGILFEERHLARLARDAAGLGVGAVDSTLARRAFHELGGAAFGEGEGILRLQASRNSDGSVLLVARAWPLGPEPDRWRAITLDVPHEGATLHAGAKVSNRLVLALAGDRVAEAGVDEGLLFDSAGRLVEGTRTNLVAVTRDGVVSTPPKERGAVAGVALEIVREAVPGLQPRDLDRSEVANLRELVALNAVRRAAPIVELDGRPVGDGRPGAVAARLAGALG